MVPAWIQAGTYFCSSSLAFIRAFVAMLYNPYVTLWFS